MILGGPELLEGLVPASVWPMGQRDFASLQPDLELAFRAPVAGRVARHEGAAVPLIRSTCPKAVPAVNLEALLFRQWRAMSSAPVGPLVDRAWLPVLRAAGIDLADVTLLNTPLSYECSPFFAPGSDRRQGFRSLLEALKSDHTLAALDPAETGAPELEGVLAEAGFLPVLLLDEHRVRLPEGGFEDWLATLPSRMRNHVRRERRPAETLPLRDLPPADRARVVELYRATCARHGSGWVDLDEAQLEVLAQLDGAWVSIARAQAQVAAFGLFFTHTDRLFAWRSGRDEAVRDLYFEATFYQGIELALTAGIRELSWSFMAGATKRRRGATRHPRQGWIWHPRRTALRWLLRPWLALFTRGAEAFYEEDAR